MLILNALSGFGVAPQSSGTLSADVATSGQAIGSGWTIGGGVSAAFDNSTADNSSNYCGTNVGGSSGIVGQDFGSGVTKNIQQVTLVQGTAGGFFTTQCMTSIKVQWSDDNSSWTDATTLAPTTVATKQTFSVPDSGAHRYWRIIANATISSRWYVNEIEMMEVT